MAKAIVRAGMKIQAHSCVKSRTPNRESGPMACEKQGVPPIEKSVLCVRNHGDGPLRPVVPRLEQALAPFGQRFEARVRQAHEGAAGVPLGGLGLCVDTINDPVRSMHTLRDSERSGS